VLSDAGDIDEGSRGNGFMMKEKNEAKNTAR
jgi:hypothetical protein